MSFWTDKKLLITGSEGLMGKPMSRMAAQKGAAIIPYDKALGADVLSVPQIYADFEHLSPDIVIHLAAVSGVNVSRETPQESFALNVMGTVNVLEASRRADVSAVVVAASNHIYGQQSKRPTREDAQFNQLDPYSASKTCADYVTRSYAHTYNLPTAVIRNTNCYGPNDPHGDHIIPGTIRTILSGNPPVIRGKGETKKAYLYVDDVAEAYLMVAEWLAKGGKKGEAFNVSTTNLSVITLVNQIMALMEDEIAVISPAQSPIIEGRPDDQADEDLDWTKIMEEVGWTPKHTLAQGLAKTIDGFRARRKVAT